MIAQKPLASAMMVPTRQVTVPTSAGRSVRFTSGIATIYDTDDLPYLLARDDVKLMITPYAMSWMDGVLAKTSKINADVHWPEPPPPDPPGPDDEDDDDQPEIPDPEPEPAPVASLDAALKGKPGWQKPHAS